MKIFNQQRKGLMLQSITELHLFRDNKFFFQKIKEKLACDEDFINTIRKTIPEIIRVKIEGWEDSEQGFYQRAKIWITTNGNTVYDEREDFGSEVTVLPTHIWSGRLEVQENNIADLDFVYRFSVGIRPYFLLYLSGEKFEKKPEKEGSLVDMRFFEDKLLPEAILFKLPHFDFNYLNPYHCDVNNTFITPDEIGYYVPLDSYRKYSNWFLCTKEIRNEVKETGIHWTVEYHDLCEEFLPKLSRD